MPTASGRGMSIDGLASRRPFRLRDALRHNPDGSLALYLQHDTPGKEREANRLPAPKGAFVPMLRMFQPSVAALSVIDGSWQPPAIVRSIQAFRTRDARRRIWNFVAAARDPRRHRSAVASRPHELMAGRGYSICLAASSCAGFLRAIRRRRFDTAGKTGQDDQSPVRALRRSHSVRKGARTTIRCAPG